MCSEMLQFRGIMLPTEVLEMVLAHVPLVHLLTVDTTVCRYWHRVILNPAFIPWRKLYHRLKLAPLSVSSAMLLSPTRVSDKLSVTHIMSALCQCHGLTSLRDCITSLIRMVGSRQGTGAGAASKLVLQRHRLYTVASDTLENMEEALLPRPFNLWHVAALIVFLSEDVWDVESVVHLLLHQDSPLTSGAVIELLYCLAAFLFYCTDQFNLPTRYHHLVYYTLQLYENRWRTAGINYPDEHQQVSVEQQHQQVSVEQQHQQVSVEQQHQQVSVEQQHQQVSVGQQHQQVSVGQQHQQVSVGQQHQQVSVGQQHQQVSVGQQHQQVSVGQQHQQVSLGQQHQQVSVGQQHQQVSVGQQHQKVSVGQQHQQVSVGQQHQQVSVGQQHQQVSVGQQHQQVSVGQQYQQVSVGQQHQQVSVGHQHQQVSVGQQHQQVSVGQETTPKVVQNETRLHLTHEQLRIINHNIEASHVVKINAFAGAGKTTTLLWLCQQRPHHRFLLLVHTSSLKEQCDKTFPLNVEVKTAHSMALAHIGRRFSSINKLEGTIAVNSIFNFIDKSVLRLVCAGLVKTTVNRFVCSADECITLQHVPDTDDVNVTLTVIDKWKIRSLAESVWKEMNRCSDRQRISMTQDGLVKAWQLKKPRIQGYDVLLVDGAEDVSAAVMDILLSQHCAKVIVGDSYQQLGSSGGTVSALDNVTPTHTFYLSQSFRFGPEVSYVAQCVLESLLGVRSRTLVGARIKDSFIHVPDPCYFDPSSKLKRAYIAKTNLEIYKTATLICEDKQYIAASMAFAGGLSKYGYDDVMDIYKLYQIQEGIHTRETLNIQNPIVAKFETIASLKHFAENLEDRELHSKIMMFHYSGGRTPYHLSLLTQRCSTEASEADITFTTIDKAKGLEWDWIILKDDLPYPSIDICLDIDENMKLLYVSVTRAKKYLKINSAVLYAILYARDKLEVLVARKAVEDNVMCSWCYHTPVTGSPFPLLTKTLPYSISDKGERYRGGYVCNKCAICAQTITSRLMRARTCLPEDSARVARMMLITGKQHLADSTLTHYTEKDWQQHAQRESRRTAYFIQIRQTYRRRELHHRALANVNPPVVEDIRHQLHHRALANVNPPVVEDRRHQLHHRALANVNPPFMEDIRHQLHHRALANVNPPVVEDIRHQLHHQALANVNPPVVEDIRHQLHHRALANVNPPVVEDIRHQLHHWALANVNPPVVEDIRHQLHHRALANVNPPVVEVVQHHHH